MPTYFAVSLKRQGCINLATKPTLGRDASPRRPCSGGNGRFGEAPLPCARGPHPGQVLWPWQTSRAAGRLDPMQSGIVRAVSRLLVVEDHPATRAGLVACLEAQPDLAVCGRADSWREAMVLTRELHPDLLLLDLHLKDGSGWTLIEALAAAGELPPTLVFSAFDEEIHAERLLRAGARGYWGAKPPRSCRSSP